MLSIERAALIEPIRPQLIGRRLIRNVVDRSAVDNDLSYDSLISDLLGRRAPMARARMQARSAAQLQRSIACGFG
jgi:hypothetical protein